MPKTALGRALATDYDKDKIEVPWKNLAEVIDPHAGNLIVCLGAPGEGKSAFALNWGLKISKPSLILSLDTDITTQAVRTASLLSGTPMSTVKEHAPGWSLYVDKMAHHVRIYDILLRPKNLADLVKAETEYWGEPPALTVVDNVSNMMQEGGYEEYRTIFTELHHVARATNTCVLALHHIKRGTAGSVLGLYSGQYAGEQEAEMVLGLWSNHSGVLNISIDKNRSGMAAPDGSFYVSMNFDKRNMQITEPQRLSSAESQLQTYMGGFSNVRR
jgi:hypothetical protein